jgi:hexokinase
MAVNLESGNFTPPHLTDYDDMLDDSDLEDSRGKQRFEKAVSGTYVPRLFRLAVGDETLLRSGIQLEALDAAAVAGCRGDLGIIGEAAASVINRSATLIAAAIAGLVKAYGPGCERTAVLAEGSFFRETSGYRERVEETLRDLLPEATLVQFLPYPRGKDQPEPNLLGAACAALQSKNG